MILKKKLSRKSFSIYGFGKTGESVLKFFNKENINKVSLWDDSTRKRTKSKFFLGARKFEKALNKSDYIIISPGVNIKKSKFKNTLIKNSKKIITDLDLFYILNPKAKTIVVTGTNGKSTTCKIIEHIFKKKNIDVRVGGNIGQTILNLKVKSKTWVIIEASSFHLAYSKFIKPKYAILLNISKDHIDWHGNMKNYIKSKFNIFKLQKKKDHAFIQDKNLIKKFKRQKMIGKLKKISSKPYLTIKTKITNKHLKSKANENNMPFILELCRKFNIKNKFFIKYCNTFKGLKHRHEIIYKKKNIIFINDSKATSFQASKYALQGNKNIFWIVGGLPKIGDKFNFKSLKKNVLKSFIIGNHINFFKKKLKNKINYKVTKTIRNTLKIIFQDIKRTQSQNLTILLSPASASYDQYKNFSERGLEYEKIVKFYAKKYL